MPPSLSITSQWTEKLLQYFANWLSSGRQCEMVENRRHCWVRHTELCLVTWSRSFYDLSLATQKKLAYLGFQCLDPPPYSPDLAPSDYHMFPGLKKKQLKDSWFQTFAVYWMLYAFFWVNWMLYAFFWVIPRRLKFICRRFGTLCLFHLHRQVGACRTNSSEGNVGVLYGKRFGLEMVRAIRTGGGRSENRNKLWKFPRLTLRPDVWGR